MPSFPAIKTLPVFFDADVDVVRLLQSTNVSSFWPDSYSSPFQWRRSSWAQKDFFNTPLSFFLSSSYDHDFSVFLDADNDAARLCQSTNGLSFWSEK